ncbi:MAG: poly-gamma-glutamate system protein [Candidatus Saccharicenans sp.]|nr:MAG: poly-gamma-glutamate system protein [Candidatus Aminicenantes bacterium]HEK86787.1 poly-gamma-glutamate system protein [Candidatus Aminicenantes bacterium]
MPKPKINSITLYLLAAVSLIFYFLYLGMIQPRPKNNGAKLTEIKAARLMLEAEKITFSCEKKRGLQPEKNFFDLNKTGLIGLEHSPLTTTLGNLEAKRTTTNPNMAALLVHLLEKAGVKEGDYFALGASGSFPALILASICAAEALKANLTIIASVGASQWGANNPEFSILDLEECWRLAGFDHYHFLAISWGGEDDSGREFPEDLKLKLREKAAHLGIKFLEGEKFQEKVQKHLYLYEINSPGGIKAFINAGGSLVNLGRDSSILELPPGLANVKKLPPPEKRGLIQEMSAKGIPVIHLLNIRSLVQRYNLPWDPQPLPQPGQGINWPEERSKKSSLYLFVFSYLFVLFLSALVFPAFIHKKHGRILP